MDTTILLNDNFEPTLTPSYWPALSNGSVNTNFGGTGNALFFGDNQSTDSPRFAATKPVNVPRGGLISFNFIFGSDSNGGENAESGEDVVLEYSTNGGLNWTILNTYDTGNYTSWTEITESIPLAAQTSTARFRWRQVQHSGPGNDNWGLDNVTIEASSVMTSLIENLEAGINQSQWSQISNAQANTTFGGDGNSLFFSGGSRNDASRVITTNPINVANGGSLNFDLIFGNDTNGGENADAGEDVVLEYSLDQGNTWTVLNTYDTEDYTSWTTLSEIIPAAAQSTATAFRWRQVAHTGSNNDHWALDNIILESATSVAATPETPNAGIAQISATSLQGQNEASNSASALNLTQTLAMAQTNTTINPQQNVLFDDFDPDVDDSQWRHIGSATANSTFNGTQGKALFFTGGFWKDNSRVAETKSVNVTNGGTIAFDLIFGNNINGGDNADGGEDVVLEYSLNSGSNWTVINTYDTEAYTNWTSLRETIPEAAYSSDTLFRWRQIAHNGYFFDNWGLDNVEILSIEPLGFESGNFSNWSVRGNAAVVGAYEGINPTQGNFQGLITTADGAVSEGTIAEFLGVNTESLDTLINGDAKEGSALKLEAISVQAGDVLSFDWNFLSNDPNDFAVVSVTPSGGLSKLADISSAESGYQSYTYEFTSAGTYTVGIGVLNGGNGGTDSALLVDNLVVA